MSFDALLDSYADRMARELVEAFGDVYGAPAPCIYPPLVFTPAWWREWKMKRAYRRATGQHFTELSRMRYWQQRAAGQGYDDAGGYILRCWCAASGYPFREADYD
jgi:hypothetical protein